MNKKEQLIAAVDIGTTKVVALVGKINENEKLEILALESTESKGIKRGVVLNIDETVKSISKVVNAVKAKSGYDFKEVFVGIAGQHIDSIRTSGHLHLDSYEHEITQADIDTLISDIYKIPIDVGKEILHVIPQSYSVDNEIGIKNPIGFTGKRLAANFHIVTGEIASAKNIEKCINRCGLKIIELILEPLASSASVLTEDEKEAGVALIDIGGGTTDIAVYYDNIIRHTAVIPIAGSTITNDIKEGCSILLRDAEKLKTEYGSALGEIAPDDKIITIPGISGREPKEISFKRLAYIIQARMEEIIGSAMFQIEKSGFAEKLSAGIVVTGGGALLKDISQLINFFTGYDVRIGYPSEYLAVGFDKDINHPKYATSIGLILKGSELLKKNNYVPEVKEELTEKSESEEQEKPKQKKESGIFAALKRTLTDIFEENDARLQ
jgi:cell division protein FtsA